MTRAFVLSGGASLGAIEVGMLQALFERGIAPDLIVGTSAGALNGAFIAVREPTVEIAHALGAMDFPRFSGQRSAWVESVGVGGCC